MAKKKPKRRGDKKTRTEFKKNYQSRKRPGDLTRRFQQDDLDDSELASRERLSGKGDLTRHRTVVGSNIQESEDGLVVSDPDEANLLRGRVLRVHGLECVVRCEDGAEFRCAVRQVLKSISTQQRHVLAAGDIVSFRPEGTTQGIIHSIHPRRGVLSRTSRGKRHILVSNVDLVVIVASAADPDLKPHLIDRYLVTTEQASLEPLIVINKIDLVDPSAYIPLVGVYSQLGYQTLLMSATENIGIRRLRDIVGGRQSVFTGQSGVGKSSLLNSIQEGLGLRVQTISSDNRKGKHTTTTAELISLENGGYLIDTPGIRQFELWDVAKEEVAGLFRDIRPFVSRCRFPDCTHIHEVDCAVLEAVADNHIDPRRYDSFVHLFEEP